MGNILTKQFTVSTSQRLRAASDGSWGREKTYLLCFDLPTMFSPGCLESILICDFLCYISVKLVKLLPTLNLGPTVSAFSGHAYSYFGSRTNPLFSPLRWELCCCMSISGFTWFTQETPRESKWISGVDLRKDALTLGYKTILSWDGGRKAWDNASREKMLQKTQWVPAGFSILYLVLQITHVTVASWTVSCGLIWDTHF